MENRFGGALSYYIYSRDKDWSPLWTCRLYSKVAFEEVDKRGGYVGKYWTARGSASDAEYDSSDSESDDFDYYVLSDKSVLLRNEESESSRVRVRGIRRELV